MYNMFKVKNKDIRTTPWRRSGVFVNLEHVNDDWGIIFSETIKKI